MTRKDYVAIATTMRERLNQSPKDTTGHDVLTWACEDLADLFERDNPPNDHGGGFNKARFLVECGIKEGVNNQGG